MSNWRFFGVLIFALLCAPAQAAGARLPLWEASGAQGTVYLFGSVHVCNASCFPLPSAVLRRVDASKVLAVELDPQRSDIQEKLMGAAMLPAGKSLTSLFSNTQWQDLVSASIEVGLPSEILAPMQPWMADMMLGIAAAQKAGYDVSQGVDVNLMQRASERGLVIEELETIDMQIAAISGGSQSEQLDALKLTVAQLRSGRTAQYLEALVRGWKSGDADGMDRLIRETMVPGQMRTLIDQRNVAMSDKIVRNMADGKTRFVVVGMGHLVGTDGIPQLLKRRGYRVRQIGVND